MKRQKRAFKIVYSHKFLDGLKAQRSDYYETEDGVMIANLIKSQGAFEVPLRDSPPIPDAPLAVQPTPERVPETDADVVGEAEPDWDYRTISDMKAWLSASSVEYAANARKPTYVDLCKRAWLEGRRPSPFWGLPGGPEVAAGLPGPDASNPDVLKDAIATATESGAEVPVAIREALDALLNPVALGVPEGVEIAASVPADAEVHDMVDEADIAIATDPEAEAEADSVTTGPPAGAEAEADLFEAADKE